MPKKWYGWIEIRHDLFEDEFNCNRFLKQLNSLHQSLTFTHEKESMANYLFWMCLWKKVTQNFSLLFTGNLHFPASTIAGIRLDPKAEKTILLELLYTEPWEFVRLQNYPRK